MLKGEPSNPYGTLEGGHEVGPTSPRATPFHSHLIKYMADWETDPVWYNRWMMPCVVGSDAKAKLIIPNLCVRLLCASWAADAVQQAEDSPILRLPLLESILSAVSTQSLAIQDNEGKRQAA